MNVLLVCSYWQGYYVCYYCYNQNLHFSIRYKYENNIVMDVSSSDGSSPLQYQLYGNGKIGVDVPPGGSQNQLLDRQVFIHP